MSSFFRPMLLFLFHVGYFGPLVLGIVTSFIVLPFGNDLLLVGLVAEHPGGWPLYVLSSACGSTAGIFLLALLARKLGEEGISRVAGQKQFDWLKKNIGGRAGLAVAIASLAPPPFPYTIVMAASSALGYPMGRLLTINFFSRAVRFAVVGFLAIKFGHVFLRISRSSPFFWSMVVFIFLCFVASGFSIWHWIKKSRGGQSKRAGPANRVPQ
ncbi:MAG: VTT domain-containing protein [Acidobacteriaceae bacterium]